MAASDNGPLDSQSAKKMMALLKFLDKVPKHLKHGPWSPVAYLSLVFLLSYLLYIAPQSFASYKFAHHVSDEASGYYLQLFRLVIGSYGVLLAALIVVFTGFFPFTSYTLTSWNLMTARLLFAYLGQYSTLARTVADGLRFPALVGNSVTVLVWWLVLVPVIDYLMRHDPDARTRFRKFNMSPLLINIHFLNLPIVAAEFLWTGSKLEPSDLWFGLLAGLVYLTFYLLVLDAAGFHFYIILTPRTPWCFVSYFSIFGLYFATFYGWNCVLDYYNRV